MQSRAITGVIQQRDHGVGKLTIEQNLLKIPKPATLWRRTAELRESGLS